MPALYEKLLDADGIVLGSPVYINSITAQLKTMLDRMADSVHCLHFTGKYGCAVSTAGGAMAEETAEYMNSAMRMMGATTVGTVSVNFMGNPDAILPAEKKAKELGRNLTEAIRTQWKDPVQQAYHADRKVPHETARACKQGRLDARVRSLDGDGLGVSFLFLVHTGTGYTREKSRIIWDFFSLSSRALRRLRA